MKKAYTKKEANAWKLDKIYTIFDIRGNKIPEANYYESCEEAISDMNKSFYSRTKVMVIFRDGSRKLVQYHDKCYC